MPLNPNLLFRPSDRAPHLNVYYLYAGEQPVTADARIEETPLRVFTFPCVIPPLWLSATRWVSVQNRSGKYRIDMSATDFLQQVVLPGYTSWRNWG